MSSAGSRGPRQQSAAGRPPDGPTTAGGPSDAQLLRRHVEGDPHAFGELFLRHRDRLWAVAIRTLGDPDEAADALQDAMISAFRRADGFRGDSAVTTWLHRIVVNACLDRLRRKSVRPASGTDERTLDSLASGRSRPDPTSDSDTSLDVLAALRTLPHDQRAALVLVDMLGYPVADAAEVLGVSIGTVKSRCARGRARLLPRLAHLRPSSHSAAPSEPAEDRPQARSGPARNQSAAPSVQPAQEGGDDPR
jgi:RNA polymerase sigma-70 factor, ECF subfamily